MSVCAILVAPPPSASNFPSIAPKPKMSAICPSVPPIPASIVATTLSKGIPSISAVKKATIINDINVLSLSPIIKTSKIIIAIATVNNGHCCTIKSIIFPSFHIFFEMQQYHHTFPSIAVSF